MLCLTNVGRFVPTAEVAARTIGLRNECPYNTGLLICMY